MPRTPWRNWLSSIGLAALSFWLGSVPAAAQCAMCYATASGSGSRTIRALQIGILILLVPTITILGGLVVLALRRRNSSSSWESDAEPGWEANLLPSSPSPGETASKPLERAIRTSP